MAKISVVINTLNEEDNIADAIDSVKKLADEIVVVDMHSDDKTTKIAEKKGASVYMHKRMGYVEPARNFAIEKSKGDWILILDADERIPIKLSKKLRQIADEGAKDYWALPRKNIIFGKWIKHSRWWPDYNIRFFKKGNVNWSHVIHSVPETIGQGGDIEAKEDLAIVHYHYNSISQFINRMDRYTNHQAKDLVYEGYLFKWQDLVTKPAQEFFSRYFFGKGYKDGVYGLVLALFQMISEATKYIKIWELQGLKQKDIELNEVITELKKVQKDANYWYADTLLKEKGGTINRIKRKYKLS